MSFLVVIAILAAIVLSLTGIFGAIAPAVPGPPLSFGSLLIVYFLCPGSISTSILLLMLALTIGVSILDYIAPIWLTKLGGGSKKAVMGSTIGLFAGLLFMPIGLIVGPLTGAFIGEMMNNSSLRKSTKVALMSFISFLLTTGLKLIVSGIMTYYTFEGIYHQLAASLFNVLTP